jgi:hypothetical protein
MQKNGLNNLKRNRMATAVEWYQKAIFEILKEKENLSDEIFLQNILNAHLQAKEMEKQHIINARQSGINAAINGRSISNIDYYNETYKPE